MYKKAIALKDMFKDGKIRTISREEMIQQSIILTILSLRGERVMKPSFGSQVTNLLFDLADEAYQDMATLYITQALVEQEPRVIVREVLFRFDEEKTFIEVNYQIRDSAALGSAVVEVGND